MEFVKKKPAVTEVVANYKVHVHLVLEYVVCVSHKISVSSIFFAYNCFQNCIFQCKKNYESGYVLHRCI